MTKSKKPIGYKVTPKHTRFKPGQSGNPKGRPKKKDQLSWAEGCCQTKLNSLSIS